MKFSRNLTAALLLCAILAASCGTAAQQVDTTAADTTTAPAETTGGYDYPDVDLGGRVFKVMTAESYWGMNIEVAVEEQNGEPLNDALYERNIKVEEALNCKIEDSHYEALNNLAKLAEVARTEVLAGDSVHDVFYIPSDKIVTLATDNMLQNLNSYDALQLDEPYWDNVYNEMATFNGNLLGASGDAFLMSYDSQWAIFFNEDILADNKMDAPYQLVRDGKWTLDELHKYAAALANLNSDESFDWKDGGSAVYGIVSHPHAAEKLLFATDNNYVTKEGDKLTFTAGDERYFNTIDKLAKMFGEVGTHLKGNSQDFSTDKGYVYTFMNNRAAFLTAELKTANNIRDMKSTFGIVPMPKYDETQKDYRTNLMTDLLVMTIPVTAKEPEKIALVMDALAYESSQIVIPTYFDVIVSQKGLRNEDSIEMMEIMKKTRGVDIAVVYGWNIELVKIIREKVLAGDGSVASDLASNKTVIETEMEKFKEMMGIK